MIDPRMINRDAIAALIPHAGEMCLLERVVEWDEHGIVLATTTHRSPQNPLRSDGRLRSVHLCEYGAQAMAVHGGLVAQAAGEKAEPGMLVSLRDVKLLADFVETLEGELIVRADRLMAGAGSWQYAFTILHGDEVLAQGRAAVILKQQR